MSDVVIFQAEDGTTQLEVQLEQDTVWLNQAQLVDLFQRDQSVLSRHIRNVFKEGELEEKSNMQKMHIANSDKPVVFYNLDVIISVGYRVKSQRGTQFRQWATRVLRNHQGGRQPHQSEKRLMVFSRPFALLTQAAKAQRKPLRKGFDPLGDFAALREIKVFGL